MKRTCKKRMCEDPIWIHLKGAIESDRKKLADLWDANKQNTLIYKKLVDKYENNERKLEKFEISFLKAN